MDDLLRFDAQQMVIRNEDLLRAMFREGDAPRSGPGLMSLADLQAAVSYRRERVRVVRPSPQVAPTVASAHTMSPYRCEPRKRQAPS